MSLRPLALSAAALALTAAIPLGAGAQEVIDTEQESFLVETLATGLAFPWSIAFLPGGDMLVTERDGALRVITADGLRPEPVAGVPEDLVAEALAGDVFQRGHPARRLTAAAHCGGSRSST